MGETLFISDLHLDRERPRCIELFESFLNQRAINADALYILGDLFEHWIGDDDPANGLEPAIRGLQYISRQGIPVYLMHGNRDFLIGRKFARRTGCTLLPDSCVVNLYGESALIMHGDTLCTDDLAYQKFRRKTRSKLIQRFILSLSLNRRRALAAWLRNKSQTETGKKTEVIMDVNSQAVENVMREHSIQYLIHGHTHRPAVHELDIDGMSATRIVLGDWYEQGSLLSWTKQGFQLEAV